MGRSRCCSNCQGIYISVYGSSKSSNEPVYHSPILFTITKQLSDLSWNMQARSGTLAYHLNSQKHLSSSATSLPNHFWRRYIVVGWLGSRVISVLDSGAEGPEFKSQPRRCPVTVLDKLFTPIVPLFTKQHKNLSYRRGTARCVVSIEILPIATQQCRNYLYDKS